MTDSMEREVPTPLKLYLYSARNSSTSIFIGHEGTHKMMTREFQICRKNRLARGSTGLRDSARNIRTFKRVIGCRGGKNNPAIKEGK